MPMGPKCSDCFFCRRGSIVTYQPSFTCFHPVVIQMDVIARLPEQCGILRAKEGMCGPEGALFQPNTDEAPQPMHRFCQ